MKKIKIAFIPGAFRPLGNHHMKMVEYYSNNCDKVVLVVSNPKSDDSQRLTNKGNAISPEDAKNIIDLCLTDSCLKNVTCQISRDSNPIQTILRNIATLKDCDVVLGVSSKDNDIKRFDSIDKDYFKNNNVQILSPIETAFEIDEDTCPFISASEIRKHIDDKDMLKVYLPVELEDETFEKIYGILNGETKNDIETNDELRLGSQIFQNLLQESLNEDTSSDDDSEEIDEEYNEYSEISMCDDNLNKAECEIIAYNTHILEGNDKGVYNPKTNPEKAVDMVFHFDDGNTVEVFLDTESHEWDSRVNDIGKLSPEQMGEFFKSRFCHKLTKRLKEIWPESDPFFAGLLEAVQKKKINVEPCGIMTEGGEFRKGNIDKKKSRGKNAAGEQIYTNSGRKIVSFSDFGVKHTEDEAYYCWPEKNKEFKWSQWADWEKAKLCCRCRFQHNEYLYGVSLSLFPEDNENRGFRSYNLDLEPKLQYLTPNETSQIMDLSIIKKFLRNCIKRLNKFMQMSDQEIYEKINTPERCTLDDIRKTKHVVKNTMKAIRDRRADTFIYT